MKHVMVTVSRKELKALGACKEAMALYEETKRLLGTKKALRLIWSPLSYVWFAKNHPGLCWWAVEKGVFPQLTLNGCDLSGASLVGAELSEARLGGCNLSGADLSMASLIGARIDESNLSGTNLSKSNLARATLHGSNLSGAKLSRANLYMADLRESNLSGADFSESNLKYADLLDAYYPSGKVPAGWKRTETGHLTK